MQRGAILDTGPLVAFLNHRDRHHDWSVKILDETEPPLLTCEAVLSEAIFLLRKRFAGADAVMTLLERDLVRVTFDLHREVQVVRRLLRRYADRPASLADACLVRMAELETGMPVLTLDHQFRIYRMRGRQVIPTLMPAGRRG